MKSNKTLSNILFILPLMLLVVACIIVAIFGFNTSIDYKTYYQFDVRFNATLSDSNIASYKAEFKSLAEKNNVTIYSLESINENINAGLEVKVLKGTNVSDAAMQTRLTGFENDIKAITGINDDAHITIEKEVTVLPHTWVNSFVKGLLTILVGTIVVFLYVWIRFEIKLATAYVLAQAMGQSMIFSLVALLRLPVTLNFMAPYLSTFVVLSLLFAVIYTRVRTFNTSDKQNNLTLVNKAMNDIRVVSIILICVLALIVLVAAVAYTSNSFTIIMQVLLGIATAVYSIEFVLIPTWIAQYNRGKDSKLLNKQKQASEPSSKDKDKLVV